MKTTNTNNTNKSAAVKTATKTINKERWNKYFNQTGVKKLLNLTGLLVGEVMKEKNVPEQVLDGLEQALDALEDVYMNDTTAHADSNDADVDTEATEEYDSDSDSDDEEDFEHDLNDIDSEDLEEYDMDSDDEFEDDLHPECGCGPTEACELCA